ncbi:MAG: hypothetical protein A3K04_06270 [Gallionellales bacterium RBG_16_56_9]|nr:MAG: hypothetical protein A3K04_06270 [Gallionellales bacterium RBG_16_56_9]
MQEDEKSNFLRMTSEAADIWEKGKSENPMPLREISERIEKMEDAAKALQRAIYGLQGDPYDAIQPHFDYLIWGSAPPIKLPEQLRREKVKFGAILEDTFDKLQVLRDAGDYARSHIQIDRTAKPSAQIARSLVFWVVTKYRAQFGAYPASHKTAWFPEYMSELGDVLSVEVKFGFSMVSTVIEEMKKSDPTN